MCDEEGRELRGGEGAVIYPERAKSPMVRQPTCSWIVGQAPILKTISRPPLASAAARTRPKSGPGSGPGEPRAGAGQSRGQLIAKATLCDAGAGGRAIPGVVEAGDHRRG